jgi:D-psicose/D-tagatose/L-ribulose 3-epimerase
MRFGLCGYLTANHQDGTSFDLPAAARAVGFDYLELPLTRLASLAEDELEGVQRALARVGLPCEACNLLFPGELRLTGPQIQAEEIDAYLRRALPRAQRMGAQVVVFGSGKARSAPPGYPLEQAWQQLVELLRRAGDLAAVHALTIVIEPLNRAESNLVNQGVQALALAQQVAHPNVAMLLDNYHLARESENPQVALECGPWLRHVHLAEPAGRTFPIAAESAAGPVGAFFAALRQAGYDGRMSLEAGFGQFQHEAPLALALMRRLAS